MPSPKQAQGSPPKFPDFAEKLAGPKDANLTSEIQALRKEVAELKALLAPPSSIILTGVAVNQFLLAASQEGE